MRLYISKFIKNLLFKLFFRKIYKKKLNDVVINFKVNNSITFDRALYYYEKDTINWINNFEKNKIFWDIGSCTGLYSIYAFKKRSCQVYAFEPFILNYELVLENFRLNDMSFNALALNMFLGNKTSLDEIFIKKNEQGSSQNLEKKYEDANNSKFLKQRVIHTSIDDLIENFGFDVPNHIKIDVERSELNLILGAQKTLQKKEVKSIAIECNERYFNQLNDIMIKNQFKIFKKFDQGSNDFNLYYLR